MKTFVILCCSLFFIFSCELESEDKSCATFDMRQCNGNPWLVDNVIPSSEEEHAQQLEDYLEGRGLIIKSVSVDNSFHEIVCEACFNCPQGPRYRVELAAQDTSGLKALDLFSLEIFKCLH